MAEKKKKELTPSRKKKFLSVADQRQSNVTIILENIQDPHNISAILRSADSVGLLEIYVVYTEPNLQRESMILGKRTSKGTRKWVDVHLYNNLENCIDAVRKKYDLIVAAHFDQQNPQTLHDIDFKNQTIALAFGNEADGLSDEFLKISDHNFYIPQVGMAQSLNVSVACAVSLYEAYRQKKAAGHYDDNPTLNKEQKNSVFKEYERRSFEQINNHTITSID